MGLRAAFFDVGDTLVENFRPLSASAADARAALRTAFGDRPWFDRFITADLDPVDDGTLLEQDTTRWMAAWFEAEGLVCDIDLEALRTASVLPLELVSTPVPGAADALRWCKATGLRVVLVTNTLYRGDAEVLADWTRAGLGPLIDGVVSSHSVGRRKPHPLMFLRALELSGVGAAEAVMIGDNPVADIQGAGALGLRTVYRRTQLRPLPAEVRPDATVDDLVALPAVLRPWVDANS
ncbi:MAG TPA: HAD family hydrolase [Candidatus Saccharimonadales bacterium]|nr:HAD family hydrolase [Candidatus Saccharimonadales bacterium]